jgi:hypothetical protein
MFDFGLFKTGAQALKTQATALRQRLEKARRRREDIQHMALPREEVAALLADWVDQRAAQYPGQLRASADFILRNPARSASDQSVQAWNPFQMLYDPTKVSPEAFCYLLGEQIKAGLRRAVLAMDYPTEGPPRATRVAELRKLNEEIEQLEAEEKSIAEQVADLRKELT